MVKTANKEAKTSSQTAIFMAMVLDMSWRLALAVLLPLIGGFKLDQKLDSSPWLTISGFILAVAGMTIVLWSSMKKANSLSNRLAAAGKEPKA